MALILVPFSGRAGDPPLRVVTARSAPTEVPVWVPSSLDAVYQYDDGTTEAFLIPLLNGSDDQPEAIFVEQFEIIPGQNVIDSIAVAWGSEDGTRPQGLNGRPVTLGIWSDPDNDGQPYDAILLSWVDGVVSSADTDTFVTYPLDHPITIPDGSSFFLGFKTPAIRHALNDNKGNAFAGIDTNASAGKGWIIWNDPSPKVKLKRLGNNSFIFPVDAFYPGNLMIRSGF